MFLLHSGTAGVDEYEESEEAASREASPPTPSGQIDNCLVERKPELKHSATNLDRESAEQEQSHSVTDEDNTSNNGNGVYHVSSSNLGSSSPSSSSSCPPVKVLFTQCDLTLNTNAFYLEIIIY